ncbi:MAG: DsbA family oxidoreductase [Myxococcaceae bacterium]
MKVEIWSDVVCPWCYIGKRRFETALSKFPQRDQVEVVYRSFELDPGSPVGGTQSVVESLAEKYGGGVDNARRMLARVSEVAAQDGLEYHLDKSRSENTFDAHRLLHFARTRGLQKELKERLMKAYFTEGRSISVREELVAVAAEVGLDADEVRAVLADEQRFANDVRQDVRTAQSLGVRGVPFFVLEGKYGISGAQPLEVFEQALQRAWQEASPLQVVASGEACDDTGCDVPKR